MDRTRKERRRTRQELDEGRLIITIDKTIFICFSYEIRDQLPVETSRLKPSGFSADWRGQFHRSKRSSSQNPLDQRLGEAFYFFFLLLGAELSPVMMLFKVPCFCCFELEVLFDLEANEPTTPGCGSSTQPSGRFDPQRPWASSPNCSLAPRRPHEFVQAIRVARSGVAATSRELFFWGF